MWRNELFILIKSRKNHFWVSVQWAFYQHFPRIFPTFQRRKSFVSVWRTDFCKNYRTGKILHSRKKTWIYKTAFQGCIYPCCCVHNHKPINTRIKTVTTLATTAGIIYSNLGCFFVLFHPFLTFEGAVALTCGSSFYISNTKRRASKSPAFVV